MAATNSRVFFANVCRSHDYPSNSVVCAGGTATNPSGLRRRAAVSGGGLRWCHPRQRAKPQRCHLCSPAFYSSKRGRLPKPRATLSARPSMFC